MRIDYAGVAPQPLRLLREMERYLERCGLDPFLVELVRLRASQLDGCGYCVDVHARTLRNRGETVQRLMAIPSWRDTDLFSDREKAALWWAEAVTRVSQSRVPDEVYRRAREWFSEKELADLTFAVVAANSWARLWVASRREIGVGAAWRGMREAAPRRRRPTARFAGAGSSHPEAGLTSTTEDQEIAH
ncbi:MAG TPA: carboxymuconolactone decarboxylase family protein [Vulgatibacter sp.]|nr:carboxymuconolactone decarboxylase family protein [Vulgatibacter sp.]